MNTAPQPRPSPPPCPHPAERRREPRQPRRVAVDLQTSDGMVFVGTTLDLSLGGMCLEIGAPLVAGQRVLVGLRILDTDIVAEAVVRWVRDMVGGLALAGLSLPPLPTADLRLLRTFLDEDAWAVVGTSGSTGKPPPGRP